METKSAFVAIVGRPNVGKSSLMNDILGEKVAIVTSKPQTTRTRITGVSTIGDTQLVFMDTPGLHRSKNKLSEYMNQQVAQTVSDGDVVVMVTDISGNITPAEDELMKAIQSSGQHSILAINKIDLLDKKDALLPVIEKFAGRCPFDEILPISAKNQQGIQELLQVLCSMAAPSPHFFDDDTLTDQPERVIAAEIIREKLLINLQEEIPHGTAVEIERMHERPDKAITDIEATIYCEKKSHKGMIIGKGGAMLKKIAIQARQSLETFLNCQVNLQCWVKVKDDWRQNEKDIRSFGFR